MVNFLVLTLFLSLTLSVFLFLWSIKKEKGPVHRYSILTLTITGLATGFLILASTELVGSPWINISLSDLLLEKGSAILSLLVVEIGIFVILFISREKKQTEVKNLRAISLWLTFIGVISFTGIFIFQSWGANNSVVLTEPAREEAMTSLLEMAGETLPVGFILQPVLSEGSLTRPINFTVGPHGEIYISLFDGGIVKIASGPWQDPIITPFAPDLPQITGMVFRENTLYADGSGSLFKILDTDSDGTADSFEKLIEGLPSRVYDHHSNNGIAFGPDGRLFIALGATTDHGPETDPLAGSILVFDLLDSNLQPFARGVRNPYDLTFCPSQNGHLFATDNGPDRLDETLRFIPPDELNLIEEGKSYGYPDDFGFPPPWSNTDPPIALMETAGVPAGILCYESIGSESSFPIEYQQNLFVALAGGSNPGTGHKIVRVQISQEGEQTIGIVSDFLTGLGRPVDILQYVDGSLLVLDYDLGQIYQITYSGN